MKTKILSLPLMSLFLLTFVTALGVTFAADAAQASAELKVGDSAPVFQSKTQENKDFDLSSRQGQWTVLYFYPKAETPGCTKEACAFRDNIEKIRKQGADVFGISADSVQDQAKFHQHHHLNFTLLADPNDKVIHLYGTKMPVVSYSKRWTFILDPALKIRVIEKDVDPLLDADKVASQIAQLKSSK
jgi:peroxiredoxin Q/BCP